jgi:hypothetical protein
VRPVAYLEFAVPGGIAYKNVVRSMELSSSDKLISSTPVEATIAQTANIHP